MKKLTSILLIISVIVLALIIVGTGLIILRGNEDGWICTDNGWVKHGNPSASMPTKTCVGECEKNGGTLIPGGSAENPAFCKILYSDGEKSCVNSNECQGGCVVTKISNLGKIGICKKDNDNQGCFGKIEDKYIICTYDDMIFRCDGSKNDNQEICKNVYDQNQASTTQMANPASTNCIDKGGRLEIRTGADGGQVGICIFSDGTECEEWSFMRGECPNPYQSEVTSTQQTVFKTFTDKNNVFSFNYPSKYIASTDSLWTEEQYANKDKGCDTCNWDSASVISEKTTETLDQYVIRKFSWPGKTLEEAKKIINSDSASYQSVTINGNDFIKAWDAGMRRDTVYLQKHNGYIIGLRIINEYDVPVSQRDEIQQMLASFKFTK